MMKTKLNGIDVNFRFRTNPDKNKYVLLLHGWGGSLNSFRGLEEFLVSNDYSVINLDFPGFGNSELPKADFCLDDYVKMVTEMLDTLNIDKVSVVAHSFGGRVAIKLASNTQYVNKLILVDSAGVKPRFSLSKQLKINHFRFLKWLKNHKLLKRDLSKYGSEDYKALPEQMKPVFVRIINEDLTPNLSKIACPTLLIWGGKDKSTPLYMAKTMHKKIKDSGLVVFKESGHFSYLEHHGEFLIIANEFLK